MDKAATDLVLSIVHILAKGANHSVSPAQENVFNQNVDELIKYADDDFVREFLGRVKDAHGVLSVGVSQKIRGYP